MMDDIDQWCAAYRDGGRVTDIYPEHFTEEVTYVPAVVMDEDPPTHSFDERDPETIYQGWVMRGEERDVMSLGCPRCLDRWELRGPWLPREVLAVIETHQCENP